MLYTLFIHYFFYKMQILKHAYIQINIRHFLDLALEILQMNTTDFVAANTV